MQTTLPAGDGIRWPEGRQIAVLLTFDFDADRLQSAYFRQEDLPFADRSRGLYGPDEGSPRILTMLSRQNVPATFFVPGQPPAEEEDVYIEHPFAEIADFGKGRSIQPLSDYVELSEGPEIWDFLLRIWQTMKRSIEEGLAASGPLPGGLNVQRKAKYLYEQTPEEDIPALREFQQIAAFAYAVAEQNAGHGTIVTAPTCGACGVVPAVLRYAQVTRNFTDQQICRGLAAAGIIGNLTKTNASISGAECGCQAEIGTACSMAAAALAELYGQNLDQVEYAAEVAMEHHLGLTCDPVCGLVQIPCIERNAVAAMRAMNACNLSYFLTGSRNISYDMVCKAMKETGLSLNRRFRETSEGGLARLYDRRRRR